MFLIFNKTTIKLALINLMVVLITSCLPINSKPINSSQVKNIDGYYFGHIRPDFNPENIFDVFNEMLIEKADSIKIDSASSKNNFISKLPTKEIYFNIESTADKIKITYIDGMKKISGESNYTLAGNEHVLKRLWRFETIVIASGIAGMQLGLAKSKDGGLNIRIATGWGASSLWLTGGWGKAVDEIHLIEASSN